MTVPLPAGEISTTRDVEGNCLKTVAELKAVLRCDTFKRGWTQLASYVAEHPRIVYGPEYCATMGGGRADEIGCRAFTSTVGRPLRASGVAA